MNSTPPSNPEPTAASVPLAAPQPAAASPSRPLWIAMAVLAVIALAALGLAWRAEHRGATLEQQLVRRQQDAATQAAEAHLLAKQADEGMREGAAKLALLEARLAEVAIQRGQLEDLIQSLSRSRDENLVVDVEAALRVAQQQSALTGSAEPLVSTLKQSDDRLSRYNQPRLEGVRRAIARDLDRVKAVGVTDIANLTIKLDEAVRMVDELPLLAVAEPRKAASAPAGRGVAAASAPASAASSTARGPSWAQPWTEIWDNVAERVGGEARALVRVTRIDHPEAMLLAPEQAFFVKENLKLRLLNARLALLSRQFDIAQTDLSSAQTALERYFDRSAKRSVLAVELVRQVATQARQVTLPRPEDTLAALAAAAAGR